MNEDLVLAITMLIILAVVVLFIQISQQIKVKRIQKMKIQRRFGEIPDMEEVLPIEKISVYHKHQGREDVDQVTWSDLSMDQVFQRIDQCDSAAGEAVLYNMLHCTDNGQAQRKDLLKYYEEQAEPRKKAEAILISLGKREGLYYLPEYVDTLQASHVGSVFFYRLLQILLLGSIVGGLWNIQILPLAGVMAIVNIAVYIMTRMKYEQQMSMMELIVLVIDTGKRLTKEKCAGPVQKELEEKLKELGKLDKLIGKMSAMRRNSYSSDQGVFLDYLFGITLWQLISYEKSVKWLENKRESYLQLFEEIGRLDAAISIASFRKSLPFYTEPEFHSERSVHMEEMYRSSDRRTGEQFHGLESKLYYHRQQCIRKIDMDQGSGDQSHSCPDNLYLHGKAVSDASGTDYDFHGSEGRHHEGGELFSERNEISKKNAGALFRREADDLHY